MKRFTLLSVLILALLSMAVTAVYEPYGSYGHYGASETPYTAQSRFQYQTDRSSYGNMLYGPNYYRYLDQWGPFDFKLSRTVTNDVIADLIDNFEYEDADLLFTLADLNQYDEFDREYVLNHYLGEDDFNCLNIDIYNALADLDDYDRYNPLDLEHLVRDMLTPAFLRRFDFEDYQRIANADQNDAINPITTSNAKDLSFDDLDCYDLHDYNTLAQLNPNDKWDVIDFTDFDDLDDLDKIGRKRVVFFHPEDFENFNLYYSTNPRWALYAPYLYGPFDIPNGQYGYFPPLQNTTNPCHSNTSHASYCDFYYEQGYFESGTFEFNTDIRFDSEGRRVTNTPTNNVYGSRRTIKEKVSAYEPTYEDRAGIPLTVSKQNKETNTESDKSQVAYTTNIQVPEQTIEVQKEQTSNIKIIILSLAALALLLILLFLLRR